LQLFKKYPIIHMNTRKQYWMYHCQNNSNKTDVHTDYNFLQDLLLVGVVRYFTSNLMQPKQTLVTANTSRMMLEHWNSEASADSFPWHV